MENGLLFKELLQTPNFRITVVDDADTVELCGALKVKPALCFCSRRGGHHAWPPPALGPPPGEGALRSVHLLRQRAVT